MKKFLVVAIAAENELFVISREVELRDKHDREAATKALVKECDGVLFDRFLIIDVVDGSSQVVSDFNAADGEDWA